MSFDWSRYTHDKAYAENVEAGGIYSPEVAVAAFYQVDTFEGTLIFRVELSVL